MPHESPLRQAHEQAGAQLGTYFGCILPERFGDAAAEYRFAREGVVLVDTNCHAFFYLTGPDRVRFLNALATNNIKDLVAGQGNISLLLNPQGHILAEFETYALHDRLLGVSPAMIRESTAAWLEKYIIMDDVALEDATEHLGSMAIEGPQAAAVARELGGIDLEAMPDYSHAEATLGDVPCRVLRKSLFGSTGAEFIVARAQLTPLWRALLEIVRPRRGGPIGYAALDALRLEAGIPWFGYDFDDKVIPQEAGLETSHISYTKGCYTGQEIVERVRSRGHVNRRRVSLRFSGSTLPEAGVKLLAEDKDTGQVTSAAFSPALGCGIGMGYVRREHGAPATRLRWARGEAEVIELPAAAQAAPRSQASQ